MCKRRKRPATRRIARLTTAVPLCQGDLTKCISLNIPSNRFTEQQRIPSSTSPKRSVISPRLRSTTPSFPKRVTGGFVPSWNGSTTSPTWISGSGEPTPVAVASGRQPAVIHSSVDELHGSGSDVDFYYDADSAVIERMSVIVRHLGLAVGVGACALAVGVVVVVTAIGCRYRAVTKASTAAAVAHNGYRRAATDDKLPGAAADDDGWAKNGYKYAGGYGRSYGRRWADAPAAGDATAARSSLIRCDGDGDAFVTSSFTMTSSSSRRGHVTEWFV